MTASNVHISGALRQQAIDTARSAFDGGILDAATNTFETTKPIPVITRTELTANAAARHVGNLEAAKTIISNLQEKIALEYIDKKRHMNNRQMYSQRRRIQPESGQFNSNNVEDCLKQCQSKCDLQEIAPKETIVGFAPSFIRPLPDIFTMKYFMFLVTALPNHKAAGCSKIILK